MATIPDWNAGGVIPPIDDANPTSPERAPYRTSSTDVVVRFSGSDARNKILQGLFNYRKELRDAGIVKGFQWLDGSFMEDVEALRGKSPADMDIVTFFHLPAGRTQADLLAANPELFDRGRLRAEFALDAFFAVLSTDPERLVEQAAYWYGVWGHQRDTLAWKGFVHLELSEPDADARDLLTAKQNREATVDA